MKFSILALVLCLFISSLAICEESDISNESVQNYKFSISVPLIVFTNFGEEKTNTHHYEIHFNYYFTSKDKIGIKFATWSLFRPMGILWWEGAMDINDENQFYPGRLRETGLGFTYQRMLWKGLFTSIEILPQLKTYIDKNGSSISNGFKLYTSYHLGYHFSIINNRLIIEPQIHCQWWPIDTNSPANFKLKEDKWHNYFLFEPNLYIGFKFN